jgi:hypothetical protein
MNECRSAKTRRPEHAAAVVCVLSLFVALVSRAAPLVLRSRGILTTGIRQSPTLIDRAVPRAFITGFRYGQTTGNLSAHVGPGQVNNSAADIAS